MREVADICLGVYGLTRLLFFRDEGMSVVTVVNYIVFNVVDEK